MYNKIVSNPPDLCFEQKATLLKEIHKLKFSAMNHNLIKYQTNSRVGAIRPKVKTLGTFTEELLSEVLLHKINFDGINLKD